MDATVADRPELAAARDECPSCGNPGHVGRCPPRARPVSAGEVADALSELRLASEWRAAAIARMVSAEEAAVRLLSAAYRDWGPGLVELPDGEHVELVKKDGYWVCRTPAVRRLADLDAAGGA